MIDIEKFLSGLKNLEKIRDFSSINKYTLDTFQEVLDLFEIKNYSTKRISVVGTNGKGSTSFYLNYLAHRFKLAQRIGLFISPHLISKWERIQFNQKNISQEWIHNFLNSISEEKINQIQKLSFFEFFTFLAIQYFYQMKSDLEIYEAGLGGRLDATKLVNSEYIVITKIGLDHTEILGDTLEKILIEKISISNKQTKKIFSFETEPKLKEIQIEFCKKNHIDLIFFESNENLNYLEFNKRYSLFILNQIYNTNLILSKEEFFQIENPKGRVEIIKNEPYLIYDIGHNPSAINYLLITIKDLFPNINNWQIIFACLKDKDLKSILEILTNSEIINKIYRLNDENWNMDEFQNSKIMELKQNDVDKKLLFSNHTIVLGSSRLYDWVKSFV